ncbi:MAG: DUF4435 domain-containing protein [Leptospiraceae bacterium]|nr:DUF4435 domain-containing protein [Leptospiraceae bacterium]
MDTYLDKMDKALLSPDTNLTIITKTFLEDHAKYARIPNTIFCFFEGLEDSSFYRGPIDLVFNYPNVYIYFCMGIEYLFQYYEEIESRKDAINSYNRYQLLYFADKDLDDYTEKKSINEANIFRTKFYSAENYVYDQHVLGRILEEVYFLDNKNDIISIIDNYNRLLKKFSSFILPIIAVKIFTDKEKIQLNWNKWIVGNFISINESNNELTFQRIKMKIKTKNKEIYRFMQRGKFLSNNKIKIPKMQIKKNIKSLKELKEASEIFLFLRGHYLYKFFDLYLKKINPLLQNFQIIKDRISKIERNAKMITMLSERKRKLNELKDAEEKSDSPSLEIIKRYKKIIGKIINKIKNIERLHNYNLEFTINTAFQVDNEKILLPFLLREQKFRQS